jgi:hypothetical protein
MSINRFALRNPAEEVAKQSLLLNPDYGKEPSFVEGHMVPTTPVRETQIAEGIERDLVSKGRKIKKQARDIKRSSFVDLGINLLSLVPGMQAPAAVLKGARALGVGDPKEQDIQSEAAAIELGRKLLSQSRASSSDYLTRIQESKIAKGQKAMSEAQEYAAKAEKTAGLASLANMLIGISQGVGKLAEDATTPVPKVGMEHIHAEQVAAGLTPGKDIMTTPAKEFAMATGFESIAPGLTTAGLEDLPDKNPGQWGWTRLAPDGAGSYTDPLYPDRTWEYIETDNWKGTTMTEPWLGVISDPDPVWKSPFMPNEGDSPLEQLAAYRAWAGE